MDTDNHSLEVTGPIQQTGAVLSLPLERVREFILASTAESTLRGYRADWRDFCLWCKSRDVCHLPAISATVAAYIAACAEHLKVGSIQRRLNAIAAAHKAAGMESPTHGAIVGATLKRHSTDARHGASAENAHIDRRYPRYGGGRGCGPNWRP